MSASTSIQTIVRNNHLSSVLFKPYFSLALLMLTGFTAVGIGAVALMRNAELPPNPFADYFDIFPGQPISAVEERGFSCRAASNYYTSPSEVQCVFTLDGDIFSDINVVGDNQRIREIKFTLRENTFQLGDLLVLFNVPDFHFYLRTTFAFWHDYFVSLSSHRRIGLNPIGSYLWSITFTSAER